MTVMTLLSRVLGLVREQVRAHFLGTGMASDAYGLATMIPNLFRRLLAEGAMTAAFIPVFIDYMKGEKWRETQAFLSKFLTLITLISAGLTVLGIVLTPWIIDVFFGSLGEIEGKIALTVALTELMWPYLFFVTIASVLQAVLNAHKIFGPSAFTPVLLNVAIITCGVVLAEHLPDPSYGLIIGFLVGGAVQVGFQVPFLLRHTKLKLRPDFRIRHPGVRKVLFIMVPGIFAAGVYQVNVFVSQIIAATLEEGSIASLQYSVRLQELVLGLFVVSVTQVILPTLSEQTADDDTDGVKDTLTYATGLMAFVTLPATAGLVLIGPEVIALLFQYGEFDQRSTDMTSYALLFHAMGLFMIAGTRVYQQAFFAYKDMKTPALIGVVVTVVNIVLCIVLSGPLSHGGIALAGSIAAAVNAVMLFWILRGRIGALRGGTIARRVGRITLATGVMVGALIGLEALWTAPGADARGMLALWILTAVASATAVYIIVCRVLGVDELDELWKSLRRKLKRSAGPRD